MSPILSRPGDQATTLTGSGESLPVKQIGFIEFGVGRVLALSVQSLLGAEPGGNRILSLPSERGSVGFATPAPTGPRSNGVNGGLGTRWNGPGVSARRPWRGHSRAVRSDD